MKIELVPYDEAWVERYTTAAAQVEDALGNLVVRLEHIGSTSVPGLAAKPIIDIQVSVDALPAVADRAGEMARYGFELLLGNDDRRKLYFRRRRPGDDVNVHCRQVGEFSEQAALLFRDYLRASPEARARYEAVKRELAQQEWDRVDDYADAKGDCIWALLREADVWSWTAKPAHSLR